jgi:hypothetical protein
VPAAGVGRPEEDAMDWESVDHPTLHRLYDEAKTTQREIRAMARRGALPEGSWQLARAAKGRAEGVFEAIGLVLVRPLEHYGYVDTPSNALTFAVTGGEGVHFSLVLLDGQVTAASPVVMTVPCAFMNFIVGANLDDFLGLGTFRGYFALEYLAYEYEAYVDAYSVREPWPEDDEEEHWLMKTFAERMRLRPWDDVAGRLEQLEREFEPLLRWEDGREGDNSQSF